MLKSESLVNTRCLDTNEQVLKLEGYHMQADQRQMYARSPTIAANAMSRVARCAIIHHFADAHSIWLFLF